MNKLQAWKLFVDYLSVDKFIVPTDFVQDMKMLLNKDLKGQEKNFFNLLNKQLEYIINLSEYEVSFANSNEILKNFKDFNCYSLHMSSKVFNIRFLGTYLDGKFVFLVAFFERAGKNKTNYSSYIDIARVRLMDIKEVLAHE